MQDSKFVIPSETIERQRSAMVLYEIERALGRLLAESAASVSELPRSVIDTIVARERERKRKIDEHDVKSIVRAMYLQEIVDMLRHVFTGRSQGGHISRTAELFRVLNVIDIRNAISHPNRPFFPAYWRRLAAIASDDALRGLGLTSVVDALTAAESGRLEDPPAEWIALHRWEFPNNIPTSIEHTVTGLVGRNSEINELRTLLCNPRLNLIAIVAPGGVGKTALLLEVLADMVSTPEIARVADRALYMTAKSEKLTADGVEKIASPVASLADVKLRVQKILDDASDGNEDSEGERLLLCIDNLETLLRDEPAAFEAFYRQLPPNWRVVVTSRVSVNSATVMPLKPLNKQGAEALGRVYAARRGANLSEDSLARLAKDCDRNPLAIRLCIDAYVAGKPLPEATSMTRDRVIEFSYRNLVDALLPQAKRVLECLFVSPEPVDRESACLLLHCSVDEAVEAFRQLSGTALIVRKSSPERECYELSALVRELLLLEPLDRVTREHVQRELRRDRNTEQLLGTSAASSEASPASIQYLPPASKPYVARLVNSVVDALQSQSRRAQSAVLAQVEKALDSDPQNAVLARLAGALLLELGDIVKAKEKFALAIRGQSMDIYAALSLVSLYRTDQELELARQLATDLKAAGAFDAGTVGRKCVERALREYWVTEIWLGNIDGALTATSTWKEEGELRAELGSLRAQAFRAQIELCAKRESIAEDNSVMAEGAIQQGLSILDALFLSEGYVGRFVDAGWKFIQSASVAVSCGLVRGTTIESTICEFVDRHLVDMCSVHREIRLMGPEVQLVVQNFRTLGCDGKNPLATEVWTQRCGLTVVAERRKRLLRGVVLKRPRDVSGKLKDFLLIQCEDGQKYFAYRSKVEGREENWLSIREGDSVVIEPSRIASQEPGKLPTAARVAWNPSGVPTQRAKGRSSAGE